jgi:hypothetical protein
LPLGEFTLPHDISLNEENDRIFVADRENGRVQVYSLAKMEPIFDIKNGNLFSTVYSVHFQKGIGLLFVPGTPTMNSQSGQSNEIDVFVVQENFTNVQYSFRPESDFLHRPHVLRAFGHQIWIGEIAESGGILWQMEIQSDSVNPPSQHQMAKSSGGANNNNNIMHMGQGNGGGHWHRMKLWTFSHIFSAQSIPSWANDSRIIF